MSLELLASSVPLALASQSAGITGMSHHAWLTLFLNNQSFLLMRCVFLLGIVWLFKPWNQVRVAEVGHCHSHFHIDIHIILILYHSILPKSSSTNDFIKRNETHSFCFCFCIFLEMGFYHVGQAGPELLTSGDPPASVFQSAGITGMSHSTQPCFCYITIVYYYTLYI